VIKADQRLCDICDAVIPRGTVFHQGFTTPEALKSWSSDRPEFIPGFTEERDGAIRFDMCQECVESSGTIGEHTQPVVDALH